MTLEIKYNRGTHGDSSHMLSTVVLSNENQTCRGWEASPIQAGEDVTADKKESEGNGCRQMKQ